MFNFLSVFLHVFFYFPIALTENSTMFCFRGRRNDRGYVSLLKNFILSFVCILGFVSVKDPVTFSLTLAACTVQVSS
jgi:hypothetical protein